MLHLVRESEVNIVEIPYQLQLLRNGEQICGGVIISSTKALSAAQCFHSNKRFTVFEVLAGHSQIFNYYVKVFETPILIQYFPHPDFCVSDCPEANTILNHDIAVLVLQEPLE